MIDLLFSLEPPLTTSEDGDTDPEHRQHSRFELKKYPSVDSMASSVATTTNPSKSHRCEVFNLIQSDETTNEESLKAKLCTLRKSRTYDGYGLVLLFQKHLHVIGEVDEASPTYRAGLRRNDVIIFVGKTNVEKLVHDDVKVMIRAMALASNRVELAVLSKLDIPKYKTLQEKGLINWSIMGLEK
jgi:predicted metalloprotease with PDZ domain